MEKKYRVFIEGIDMDSADQEEYVCETMIVENTILVNSKILEVLKYLSKDLRLFDMRYEEIMSDYDKDFSN